jgi:hypothetical protein
MRVFAIHDDKTGYISEIVTCPEDSPITPVLTTQPGLAMTEVELPASAGVDLEVPEDMAPEAMTPEARSQYFETITRLVEGYRVQVGPRRAPLVER